MYRWNKSDNNLLASELLQIYVGVLLNYGQSYASCSSLLLVFS